MKIISKVNELREAVQAFRQAGKSVGLVPTMGALHEGHKSLIERARKENDALVVSCFLNPTQFNNKEDLAKYPRSLERDAELLDSIGATFVFAPTPEEMYSADEMNNLGTVIRTIMAGSNAHIMAMTGSYFRGDAVPVMRPEDEMKFQPTITYNYYQQLNGYKYLKSLGIGYQFYQGKYITAIPLTLDTTKKTLIHIPNVNSRSSYTRKYDQVADIISCIGTVIGEDAEHYIKRVKTSDGRILKVGDLVEDEPRQRDALQAYLNRMDSADALDILIALGTAKEGFDWQWCECCLTIGIRASLTEVVQIIGRCTRDCKGKTHAQFTNLIPCP